jgi:hypothetical protein
MLMTENDSGYPIQEEIQAFMQLHGIKSTEELLSFTAEDLYKMEGSTMHLVLEIFRQKKEKGMID